MANQQHLNLLKQGTDIWNHWKSRQDDKGIKIDLSGADLFEDRNPFIKVDPLNPNIRDPDLSRADLNQVNLSGAKFSRAWLYRANLSGANLSNANFSMVNLFYASLLVANLSGTNLSNAELVGANLFGADLSGANLSGANLSDANLLQANLSGANLSGANLSGINLSGINLSGAILTRTKLISTNLNRADLSEADLSDANLQTASLVETNLKKANLTGCSIYGISAWNTRLEETTQLDLIITKEGEPIITLDNLEVAQFIYLLLNNTKIRDVIDTITSKAVLILGRFTPEHKAVLDALRETLRTHGYLPILFDFEKPSSRDFTETVSILAHLSRFVIVDLTSPNSVPYELGTLVHQCIVPFQPILLEEQHEFAMLQDLRRRHDWLSSTRITTH